MPTLSWRVDVERDLELLARWGPVLEGRAASLDPRARTLHTEGRADFIDEQHLSLHRALQVDARLRRLRASADGELHVAVLRFVYVEGGPEWRKRVDPRADGQGLAAAVGRRFAPPEVVSAWERHSARSLRRTLPAKYGAPLLQRAIDAYTELARSEREG